MKTPLVFLFLLFFAGMPVAGFSQVTPSDTTQPKQVVMIIKNDGNKYTGVILSDDGREVLIETETLGKIYIPKSEIRSIVKIDDKDKTKIVNGEFQPEGPFTTRYAFTTNALPIKKGENYTMVSLYGPEVHFSVTDHLNLGAMSTWIGSPLVLAAKYSFNTKNENLNFSIGSLNGTSGYLNSFRGFGGLHFANVTFGDRTKKITLGVGYAYFYSGKRIYNYKEGIVRDSMPYAYYYSDVTIGMKPMDKGPVFSFAGIVKSGARASFVLDGIVGIFSSYSYSTVTTQLLAPSYSPPEHQGYYEHVTTRNSVTHLAIVLMPGMRFQKTPEKAFQVCIAGVTWQRLGTSYSENYRTGNSFPFPMFTWFNKF